MRGFPNSTRTNFRGTQPLYLEPFTPIHLQMCANAQVNHLQEDELALCRGGPGLYTHYSAGEAYPINEYPFPADVDEVPDFSACNNDNERAGAKITHAILLKTRNDVVNMNATLFDTLLSLIPSAFKLLYEQERMMDPNAVFRQCFNWFVAKYGCTSAEDRETNRTAMATDWHPSMGFEVLTSRLFRGVTFASLSGHPITDKDTVDIGVRVLNRTGLFGEEYKVWIL